MRAQKAPAENRLLRIIKELSFCRSTEEVIQVVRIAAREATAADGVTFILREGQNVFYADENAIGPLWKGKRFPASACISGWAMLNRQVAVIEDIYADGRISHDTYRPTFVKSLLMVPVKIEEPVAAIGAYWARHHSATEEEIISLQTIADAAALALQNAQLYADLQAALARERQSSRAKDEWLSIVSHELRTPLTPVLGWIQLLQKKEFDSNRFANALEIIERNVRMHLSLVDDMLDVSRMVVGKLDIQTRIVDLRYCVTTAAEPFRALAAAKRIEFIVEKPDDAVRVMGDPIRLCQALRNLIDNAVKFTPEEGRVSVHCAKVGTMAEVAVSDTGPGVSPDFTDRLFERFSQEDGSSTRKIGGLGLGLWIVRHIVELHAGSVELAAREPNEGASFRIRLPAL